MELIAAGILRDGGSLSAEFTQNDGSLVSILLEVAGFPEPGQARRFRHLHVGSTIQNQCDPTTIIAKGSPEESALLRKLDCWIDNQIIPGSRIEDWRCLLELRSLLPTRES
jgi:hypothetical protein